MGEPALRPAAVVPLGPESVAWRSIGDRTALLGAGSALLLQVSHPVIGAGVADHSNFLNEPWERLERTLTSTFTLVFGGAAAAEESLRLRELHKSIKGVDWNGRQYHALNQDAYWWVHASLFVTIVKMSRYFGPPIPVGDLPQFYAEWRQAGELLGIPDRVMPRDLTAFRAYTDTVLREQLVDNPTVHDVLGALRLDGVGSPPWWFLPERAWDFAKPAGRGVLELTTVGLLPATVRDTLGLDWTRRDELQLRAFGQIVKRSTLLVPSRVRQFPIPYAAKRAAGVGS